MRHRRRQFACLLVAGNLLLMPAAAAAAQDGPAPRAISLTAGAVQFDLSGTGTAFGVAPRLTLPVTSGVAVEIGALISRIDEQTGNTTLIVPEVHVQHFWRTGRVRPFVGGGMGVGYRDTAFGSDADLVLSGGGGALIDVSDRLSLRAEFRLRGFEEDFVGTTAEWLGGIAWRFGG